MRLLLDTHVLLWAAAAPRRLSAAARRLIDSPDHVPCFSVASLWEIAIKASLDRADFAVDADALRRGLLENGYEELAIEAAHVLRLGQGLTTPAGIAHKNPFDRLLVAQALVEGMRLVTADRALRVYGPVVQVI